MKTLLFTIAALMAVGPLSARADRAETPQVNAEPSVPKDCWRKHSTGNGLMFQNMIHPAADVHENTAPALRPGTAKDIT